MNKERLMKVLLSAHVSEKSTDQADKHRQFAFKVARNASKLEIKAAVELMFDVKVEAVNIINTKPKKKQTGRIAGARKAFKKAYVALQPGYDIEFVNA